MRTAARLSETGGVDECRRGGPPHLDMRGCPAMFRGAAAVATSGTTSPLPSVVVPVVEPDMLVGIDGQGDDEPIGGIVLDRVVVGCRHKDDLRCGGRCHVAAHKVFGNATQVQTSGNLGHGVLTFVVTAWGGVPDIHAEPHLLQQARIDTTMAIHWPVDLDGVPACDDCTFDQGAITTKQHLVHGEQASVIAFLWYRHLRLCSGGQGEGGQGNDEGRQALKVSVGGRVIMDSSNCVPARTPRDLSPGGKGELQGGALPAAATT